MGVRGLSWTLGGPSQGYYMYGYPSLYVIRCYKCKWMLIMWTCRPANGHLTINANSWLQMGIWLDYFLGMGWLGFQLFIGWKLSKPTSYWIIGVLDEHKFKMTGPRGKNSADSCKALDKMSRFANVYPIIQISMVFKLNLDPCIWEPIQNHILVCSKSPIQSYNNYTQTLKIYI